MNNKSSNDEKSISADRSSSMESKSQPKIESLIEKLEKNLMTPIIPGELPAWTAALAYSFGEFGTEFMLEMNQRHPEIYSNIKQENPELFKKIEDLNKEDKKLLNQYQDFKKQIMQLQKQIQHAESHKHKLKEIESRITSQGLELIVGIRKQQQAIRIWLQEAYHRDTGVAD